MKKVESFGVIPVYKGPDGLYILIVKNSKGGHWGLPKGTPEENESPQETALRELEEETGIKDISLENNTFQEHYSFEQDNIEYDKTNTYFIGFVDNMDVSSGLDEIDESKWIKIDEAPEHLTHQSAIDIIKELTAYFDTI